MSEYPKSERVKIRCHSCANEDYRYKSRACPEKIEAYVRLKNLEEKQSGYKGSTAVLESLPTCTADGYGVWVKNNLFRI
jgi:hypothetical protein